MQPSARTAAHDDGAGVSGPATPVSESAPTSPRSRSETRGILRGRSFSKKKRALQVRNSLSDLRQLRKKKGFSQGASAARSSSSSESDNAPSSSSSSRAITVDTALVKASSDVIQHVFCDYVIGAPSGSTNGFFDEVVREVAASKTHQLLASPPSPPTYLAPIILDLLASLEKFVTDYRDAVTTFRATPGPRDTVSEARFVTRIMSAQNERQGTDISREEFRLFLGLFLNQLVTTHLKRDPTASRLARRLIPKITQKVLDRLISTPFLVALIAPFLDPKDTSSSDDDASADETSTGQSASADGDSSATASAATALIEPAKAEDAVEIDSPFVDTVNRHAAAILTELLTLEAMDSTLITRIIPYVARGVVREHNPGRALHRMIFESQKPGKLLRALTPASHLLWDRSSDPWSKRFTTWPSDDAANRARVEKLQGNLTRLIHKEVKGKIPKGTRNLAMGAKSPLKGFLERLSGRAFSLLCHGEEVRGFLIYHYVWPTIQASAHRDH